MIRHAEFGPAGKFLFLTPTMSLPYEDGCNFTVFSRTFLLDFLLLMHLLSALHLFFLAVVSIFSGLTPAQTRQLFSRYSFLSTAYIHTYIHRFLPLFPFTVLRGVFPTDFKALWGKFMILGYIKTDLTAWSIFSTEQSLRLLWIEQCGIQITADVALAQSDRGLTGNKRSIFLPLSLF